MSIFNAVTERSGQDDFNLFQFVEQLSPRPPPSVVPMKDFNLDIIRDCILLNIAGQRLRLTPDTTHKLIDFLRDDFTDCTKKAAVQILVHYSKMDVKLLHDRYLKGTENLPEDEKLTSEEYFDAAISLFVECASHQFGDDANVTTLSDPSKSLLKKHLQTPPILKALCIALKNLEGNPRKSICIEDLQKTIESMEIYCTQKFAPLDGMRGACVLDGILLCTSRLAAGIGTKANMADMITLTAHECSHYLARIFVNDFNFSGPFKLCEKPRFDPVAKEVPMELGRCVELLLFDNIQPHWRTSSEKAAETFLTQLESSSSLPLIKKEEHKKIGLRARPVFSPAFGIDMEDDDCVFE